MIKINDTTVIVRLENSSTIVLKGQSSWNTLESSINRQVSAPCVLEYLLHIQYVSPRLRMNLHCQQQKKMIRGHLVPDLGRMQWRKSNF